MFTKYPLYRDFKTPNSWLESRVNCNEARSAVMKSGSGNSLHDNLTISLMETRNTKISKTEKCETGKIIRVYTPRGVITKSLSEQNTMNRIQKAGKKFERINLGEEGGETIFIPNNSVNHIYFILRDTLSDNSNHPAADWHTELACSRAMS